MRLVWGLLWASMTIVFANKVPQKYYITSVQLLCSSFYVRTIDKCISNSLTSDIFSQGSKICYVVHPDRCISADFCPDAQVYLKHSKGL